SYCFYCLSRRPPPTPSPPPHGAPRTRLSGPARSWTERSSRGRDRIDRCGMTPDIPITEELLHALPKTDLHCHLDGSLRLRTLLELAAQQGVQLPADTEDGLAKAMKIGQRHGSLEEYLKGFEITLSVLQTDAALYRTAYELALDAAAENVRVLEVRYSPVLHLSKGLKPTVVVEAVLEGLRKPERETVSKAGVLVCG